jgi:hypothetical protein
MATNNLDITVQFQDPSTLLILTADIVTIPAALITMSEDITTKHGETLTAASDAAASESNAASSATAAATSASNASTSETNAASSASSALASQTAAATSAANASNSATNAGTSATNAANSATAASTSEANAAASASTASTAATNANAAKTAAETAETNAVTSANNADTSAINAAGSATAASGSATAASTSETNAAASASTATTKASEATTSATNASNSATAAATSASNAATSESNAATSASNAATSESNASTSESNAASSATSASTSASNASTSESNAATSEANALTYKNAAEAAQVIAEDSVASIKHSVDTNTTITLPGTVATFIPAEPDDNPDWVFSKEWTSYYNETRTTGKFLGTKTNLADALLDVNAAVGAYYQKSGTVQFFEITSTSGAGTETETFRAGTKHFPQSPAFAVSNETGKSRIVIWDMSCGACTMWQVKRLFTNSNATDLAYKNGLLVASVNPGGSFEFDYFQDKALIRTGFSIADRGDCGSGTLANNGNIPGSTIVNSNATAVLITTADDAPTDNLGLRDVTVYVGTTEGLSRIHNIRTDGSVTDWTDTSGGSVDYVGGIVQANDDILWQTDTSANGKHWLVANVNDALTASSYLTRKYVAQAGITGKTNLAPSISADGNLKSIDSVDSSLVAGFNNGLSKVIHNADDPSRSLNSKVTGTFNTGYMLGNASAYGCDGNSASVSDTNLWTDSPTLGTGWTNAGGGVFSCDGTQTAVTDIYENIIVGEIPYLVTFTVANYVAGNVRPVGTTIDGTNVNANGTYSQKIISSGTLLRFRGDSNFNGDISAISVSRAIPDYGALKHPLNVIGTLTKTASPGGDIYGLDGFSTSNYAEGDVTTDPDIKTGATLSGIPLLADVVGTDVIISNHDEAASNTGAMIYINVGQVAAQFYDNTNTKRYLLGNTHGVGATPHVTLTTKDGEQILYENGIKVAESSHTLAAPTVPISIGVRKVSGVPASPSTNALFLLKQIDRVLTPDEVKAMAEDDLRIINEGGLMTGTGTDVIAAHSKKADLTAACNGTVVDILKGNAVIRSISPGIGTITAASFNDDWLMVSSATGIYTEMVGTPYVPVIGGKIASRTLWFDGDSSTTDFYSDKKPEQVFEDGALQRPGSTEDYVLTHNGFQWITRFAVAPAAVDVAIKEVE